MKKTNIFNNPQAYLQDFKTVTVPETKQRKFQGKSFVCVWPTALCPAGCTECFFKSSMTREDGSIIEQYQFSKYGTQRLIDFINDSNTGYILFSGGGEPLIRKDIIIDVIKNAKSDRYVIVTNGIWGKTYRSAERVIDELYEAHLSRKDDSKLILRLSVDSFHYKSIGFNPIDNIIRVFRNKYSNAKNFELRIHTIQNDKTLENLAKHIGYQVNYSSLENVSDNHKLVKIMPNQATLTFDDGYKILVGIARIFKSDIKKDLNSFTRNIQESLDIFAHDINISEYGNPSLVINSDGSVGLDFWISYNGNVTIWQNQLPDDLYNIYTDDFEDFKNGTLSNITSYYAITNGYYSKKSIIQRVNPTAVLRSESGNVRDLANVSLFEEDKDKLFFKIISTKNLLKDNILSEKDISNLPEELVEVINSSSENIERLYKESTYDIFAQYLDKKDELDQIEWEMLFILAGLGHYNYNEDNLQKAIEHYNKTYNANIKSIADIKDDGHISYKRFENRLSFMKKETEELLRNPK